ncbi:hypothetical protein V1512DRAFT_256178 [Lipomyces arxii]|uniref:uncharacterized protein n=1 Tax=Lipomyces arxii TaxID=56418 RepID=UPI0034CD0DB2
MDERDREKDRDDLNVLSSFKEAAVAVTKLYRAAAHDISQAKQAGYDSAVEDVLKLIAEGGDVYEWAVRHKYGQSQESDHKQTDFTMTGSEFTFRSDLQLDRTNVLPGTDSVVKNTRDVVMMTPDDVLFDAAVRDRGEHIEEQRVNVSKRRQGHDESDLGDSRTIMKRHRF